MKNLILIFGISVLASCGLSKEEIAAQEKAKIDEIKRVGDSTSHNFDLMISLVKMGYSNQDDLAKMNYSNSQLDSLTFVQADNMLNNLGSKLDSIKAN
jgi:hypothetical protein